MQQKVIFLLTSTDNFRAQPIQVQPQYGNNYVKRGAECTRNLSGPDISTTIVAAFRDEKGSNSVDRQVRMIGRGTIERDKIKRKKKKKRKKRKKEK